MPLPDTGAPWPPPQWAPYYAEMRVDDAWYSGDRKRLAQVYGHHEHRAERRRRLWGRRGTMQHGRRDHRLHVPLPGDIASTSADLLFADMPRITVEDAATQTRLDELLDAGRVQHTFLSAAEQAAALSGVFLRVTWDRELIDRPLLSAVQPDQAVPEYRFGMLTAVTFWRELSGSTEATVWRHLERHEPGRILHALYMGTRDNLGRVVPLTEHPDTADLAPTVDKDGATPTGIKGLTAAYVPNMTPNRLHRSSPVGRSDYAAPIYDLFDSLDETWTSWMRDLRLARARLIVPDGYLRNNGPGQGADFDEERELWQTLKIPPNEQGAGITLSQFAIRVEEHRATAESITRQAAEAAGYSPQSFGLDTDGAPVTATEVDAKAQRSMVTRKKKAGHWKHGAADILHAFLQVDAVQFGSRIKPERPRVEFGDGVVESEQSTATTLELLARAGAVSTATKVKVLHPEWDDTAVSAEVALILAETGAGAPDPGDTYPLAA